MSSDIAEATPEEQYVAALGQSFAQALDVTTWHDGANLAPLYQSLRLAVAESVERERRVRDPIRDTIFPQLRARAGRNLPDSAGLYRMDDAQIQEVHNGLLFNGATECCDGTRDGHDALVLSVIQLGISIVRYDGACGSWVQRLYRRDLHARFEDPVEEAMELLKRRGSADGAASDPDDTPSRLIRRALMEYAERAALVDLSTAPWRMGHGNPIPGSVLLATTPQLVLRCVDTLRRLIEEHRRFVFVASEPADRFTVTLGNALGPLEFAITGSLMDQFPEARLERMRQSQRGHPRESRLIEELVRDVAPQVVMGAYRAGPHAPARMFYAHRDLACEAAAVAMADSTLQPIRGFPMLIDLADCVCRSVFDSGSFRGCLQDAYAAAGEPARYLGERETRS